MKKKGFTLIELIVSFGLTMMVVFFLLQVVISLKDIYLKSGIKSELVTKQTVISKKISDSFNKKNVKLVLQCGKQCLNIYFEDDSSEMLKIDGKLLTYGNYTTELKNGAYFGNINVRTETTNGVSLGKNNSFFKINIPVKHKLIKENYGVNVLYQYDSRKLAIGEIDFNQDKTIGSIFLKGNTSTIKFSGDTFVDPGYYVLNADGTIVENSPNVSVEGTVGDSNGVTYTLTYKLKDKDGNIADEKKRSVIVSAKINNYAYNGNYQTFVAPVDGNYKIELWGAQGGGTTGGLGAHTSGNISLKKGEQLYVYVGGKGTTSGSGGYNGGGNAGVLAASNDGGGGSTDIRLIKETNFDGLKSRIMIAAGGGGASASGSNTAGIGISGGPGGTLLGINGQSTINDMSGKGGTQILGGLAGKTDRNIGTAGSFGFGGIGGKTLVDPIISGGAGGGGGYYGGGSGEGCLGQCGGAGGGGSSFISGHTGCNAINKPSTSDNIIHTGQPNHYSGKVFSNTVMKAGNEAMPNYNGGTMTGNTGNGYAKITVLSESSD